jgi:hypothetical protein
MELFVYTSEDKGGCYKVTGSTIDHLVSLMVFLGAILLFMGLFNQTIQTAILYQRHRSIATKCSDLLDNILLNPGVPLDWGRSNCTLTGFGLQDPEFTQYRLSSFSLMRLRSSTGEPVYYPKTGLTYSNITMGFGNFLLVPYTEAISYSTAARLLGTNGTYGFQLTIAPIITVSITETQPKDPLILSVNVAGMGFQLANATVSYCFLTVLEGGSGPFPSYTIEYGTNFTDEKGSVLLNFPKITKDVSYVLIVYAHLSGLVGVGYYEHVTYKNNYVIPFIESFEQRKVLIAHSYDVHGGSNPAEISYNATFVLLSEDFTLREMPLNSENSTGKINYGQEPSHAYKEITIPTYNPGILIITYRKSAQETGVVLMPWGISSMAFPVTFGEDPLGKEWVATDIRQVLINKIAYQAKLALWSLQGYQVIG